MLCSTRLGPFRLAHDLAWHTCTHAAWANASRRLCQEFCIAASVSAWCAEKPCAHGWRTITPSDPAALAMQVILAAALLSLALCQALDAGATPKASWGRYLKQLGSLSAYANSPCGHQKNMEHGHWRLDANAGQCNENAYICCANHGYQACLVQICIVQVLTTSFCQRQWGPCCSATSPSHARSWKRGTFLWVMLAFMA